MLNILNYKFTWMLRWCFKFFKQGVFCDVNDVEIELIVDGVKWSQTQQDNHSEILTSRDLGVSVWPHSEIGLKVWQITPIKLSDVSCWDIFYGGLIETLQQAFLDGKTWYSRFIFSCRCDWFRMCLDTKQQLAIKLQALSMSQPGYPVWIFQVESILSRVLFHVRSFNCDMHGCFKVKLHFDFVPPHIHLTVELLHKVFSVINPNNKEIATTWLKKTVMRFCGHLCQ